MLENQAKVTKLEPELTKSGAKIEKSALNRPKWLPHGSQDLFRQEVSPTFINFWVSPGAQNWPKIDPWAQKRRQDAIFHEIFARKSFFYFWACFFIDF